MLLSLQLAHSFRVVNVRIGKRYRYVQASAPELMIDASRRVVLRTGYSLRVLVCH